MTGNPNGNPGAGSHHHVPLWVKIFGTGGIVGLIAALVSLFTFLHVADAWPFGRGNAPATPTGRATAAAQPIATLARFTATTGPSCSAAGATFDETGAWTPLPGTVPGNCGALEHETADNGQGANWIFNPGLNATCTFSISIPASNAITAYRVTYQAWETRPGKHYSQYRIGTDFSADQVDHLGGTIKITYGKTATGMIDLQLYDDNADRTWEVAGPVTAVCSRPLPVSAALTTGTRTTGACRVGDWRGGSLVLGPGAFVAAGFPVGCATPVSLACLLRLQSPPPRTVHAVFPHTAHRRRSPPAFGFPRQSRKGLGSTTIPDKVTSP